MAIFKCKMCGGTLEINNNETVASCEYCGTQQTLPKLDDEKRANMYDRANHFRRNNEFDKAMGIYEQILNEDSTDAEAYWSLVLCRYGIEYVEDPASHKRVPTVNRSQYTSVFDDDNYKSALQNADSYQKAIYEEEAKAINEIQKGILEISQKEEPFDVFICYKETDNNGRRTPDSVLAQDLYYQLKQEGFKVFFSRITLEDKLGSAYEPYIFAALNSSKVMVVLGTKPEYFNAVWVKNEWSRYLALIKNGAKKMLIPAYKDMDPYDLPEEFSHLQAQDMSKLGFMQDLIRGIKKIAQADEPKPTVVKETVVASGNTNIAPLLERVFMFLEDGDWQSADEYCEKVLDMEPKCAQAYLGKLMAELKVNTKDELSNCTVPFDNHDNYDKVMRFGDDNLKNEISGIITSIKERNENVRVKSIYNKAYDDFRKALSEDEFKRLENIFKSISEYKDSAELAEKCLERAEIAKKEAEDKRKDKIYSDAKSKMDINGKSSYGEAIKLFESIPGWKDSEDQIAICNQKIGEIEARRELQRQEAERQAEIDHQERAKRNKKIAIIATAAICMVIALIILVNTVIIPAVKYNGAVALMEEGDIEEAYNIFSELGDYKDAADKTSEIRLTKTKEQLKNAKAGDYIMFGTYEQDSYTSNGKENIEWLVLEAKDNKMLVISKYALDFMQYNEYYTEDIAWETCSLRKWLNNEFINIAFSAEEKALIPAVTVSADKNPACSKNPGKATQDRVFLLSINEMDKYFYSKTHFNIESAILCKPTKYVVSAANLVSATCDWWLRTPGDWGSTYVGNHGIYNLNGGNVSFEQGVRPAMWIEIE